MFLRFIVLIVSISFSTPVLADHAEGHAGRSAEAQKNQVLAWKLPKDTSKLIPDISVIGSIAGGVFRDDPVGDQGPNPARTGFNLQGIELVLQSVIDPYVRGDIFFHFHEDEVEVEEAFVTTLALPWNLQARVGKFLARFGRQNAQHHEKLDFVDYSRNNRHFFSPENFRELGVEGSILLPASWFSELSFEFLQGENEGNFDGPRKGDFAYLGHWTNTFDLSSKTTLQTGLSGAFGFNASGADHSTQIYGADLYWRYRPNDRRGLKWQTEYFLRKREDVGNTLTDGGAYTQVVGQFARRWEGGVRLERLGLPSEGTSEWSVSPVITFLASEFFKLRGQYNWVRPDNGRTGHEAFVQLQFNMGPHGAHAF
ncbi:MAG: hypothetical protein Q7T11_06650 [Deltaproteobacteria bacterium]|nr:hypothetical protein [Deltaproteobacteria bacterium]